MLTQLASTTPANRCGESDSFIRRTCLLIEVGGGGGEWTLKGAIDNLAFKIKAKGESYFKKKKTFIIFCILVLFEHLPDHLEVFTSNLLWIVSCVENCHTRQSTGCYTRLSKYA